MCIWGRMDLDKYSIFGMERPYEGSYMNKKDLMSILVCDVPGNLKTVMQRLV